LPGKTVDPLSAALTAISGVHASSKITAMKMMLIFTLPPMQRHAPEDVKNHADKYQKNRYRYDRYAHGRLNDIVQAPRSDDQMNDPDNDSADEQESASQPNPLQPSNQPL
jgi:hypothetical protein